MTKHLLSVDRMKRAEGKPLTPAVAGILNLVFCSYCEKFLKTDVTGFYLTLFLFIEASFLISLSATNLFSTSIDILARTKIFPVPPASRLLFVIVADMRRPLALSLMGSTVLFLAIVFRHSLLQAIAAGVLFTLFILVIEILFAAGILAAIRRSVTAGGVVALLGSIVLVILIGSLVFHFSSLLSMNPLLRWTTNGILAAGRSDGLSFLGSIGWLTLTGIVAMLIGRRFA